MFSGSLQQAHINITPGSDPMAIDRMNLHTLLKPGPVCDTAGCYIPHYRRDGRYANHAQQLISEYGKNEVGQRACGRNSNSLGWWFGGKGLVLQLIRYGALPLVEHLDVTAQRDGCHRKLGAMAVIP